MNQSSVYWVAFRTIVTKEILRFSRIWVQTVLPPAITTGTGQEAVTWLKFSQ